MFDPIPVSVALSRFEDVVALGLCALIDEDESLTVVAKDVPQEQLLDVLSELRPEIAILNFDALDGVDELRLLHRSCPATRLVVLADRPQSAESRTMLASGATACLATSSDARDVLDTINLVSRGLHVVPGADGAARAASSPEAEGYHRSP